MKFVPLFEIEVKHPYYPGSRCPDFHIEPDPASERLLKNHRLVVKAWQGGILVLTPVDAAGEPFIPLRPGAALSFHMYLENPDFPLFTEVGVASLMGGRRYTNAAGAGSPAMSGELALAPAPSGKPVRPLSERGVFATIEIADVGALSPQSAPAHFEVSFAPRHPRWVYYVVSSAPANGGEALGIVDADPAPSSDKVSFGAPGSRDLVANPDASDPIAAALAMKYPTMRRLRFVSDSPVACRSEPRRYLELYVGQNKVMEALPNPSIYSYSQLELGASGSPAREDAIFRVIEHLKNPLSMTGS